MRLRYKILIFEDDLEWADSIKEELIEIVESEGFLINLDEDIKHCTKESDFRGDFDKYDMILVDYDLKSEYGDQIIENIRNHQNFTDVIFYTQGGSNLLKILYSKEIQGIYWSPRIYCVDKFSKVFQNSVKKVLDLNNLRGLVMAEASRLDELKSMIFKKSFEYDLIDRIFYEQRLFGPNRSMCRDNYIDSEKYLDNKVLKPIACEDHTYVNENEEMFMSKNYFFKFDLKIKALPYLLDTIESKIVFDPQHYETSIQKKRNDLAHAIEDEESDAITCGDYIFTRDESKTLFNDLKDYNDLFESILKEIEIKGNT
ncbi:MAG TPA: response regulator [Methanosarcinaceae archaeon]|nr:response regulator [Methanosarcinaceae archaeon]